MLNLKIASWNVNSLAVRLDQVFTWMREAKPDIVSLQETKMVDEKFPHEVLQEAGYHAVFSGQKTYNGVAILSKFPIEEVEIGMPNHMDEQRRLIAATIQGIRIINVYVPNGAAVGTDKYEYKLSWLQTLNGYLQAQLLQHPKLVVMGDFNIAPEDCDVHDPAQWAGSVLVSPPEREALAQIKSLGLMDSFRTLYPEAVAYSWWDYRAASFRRNRGLRIDLMLLSKALHEHCHNAGIDVAPRKHERPSDHTPVWVECML